MTMIEIFENSQSVWSGPLQAWLEENDDVDERSKAALDRLLPGQAMDVDLGAGGRVTIRRLADVEVVKTEPSGVSDHPGALDATVLIGGVSVEITLLPRESDGLLDTWGPSREYWASQPLIDILGGAEEPQAIVDAVLDAVRGAAEGEGT